MSGRRILLGLLGLSVLLGNAGPAQAQRSPYGVEEYNAYVDTTRAQNPSEQLQTIEAFLKKYPQSVLRAFVYPSQAQAAFRLQQHAKVIEAVDGFLAMDRAQVTSLYKQSQYNDTQIDGSYYQMLVLYTFSFLQSFRNGTPEADVLAARAAERAQQALELHQQLYSQVPPPADPAQRKQFEEQKAQQEASFHKVLAFGAWRKKDYDTAAREYAILLGHTPDDAWINYQLGLASLQKSSPEYRPGFWHVARAVALNIPKSGDVREYLLKTVGAYQGVLPGCLTRQVDGMIARAKENPRPPADWRVIPAEQVNAVRQDLSVKRIFEDLKAGGESGDVIWLASCGMEFPELAGEVIDTTENTDNVVTLRVAAGQEAVDAKLANVEVKVVAPPEAKNLKAGDIIRFSGILTDYANEPQFLVKLTDGKVNPEDIPQATPSPARRRGGRAGR